MYQQHSNATSCVMKYKYSLKDLIKVLSHHQCTDIDDANRRQTADGLRVLLELRAFTRRAFTSVWAKGQMNKLGMNWTNCGSSKISVWDERQGGRSTQESNPIEQGTTIMSPGVDKRASVTSYQLYFAQWQNVPHLRMESSLKLLNVGISLILRSKSLMIARCSSFIQKRIYPLLL